MATPSDPEREGGSPDPDATDPAHPADAIYADGPSTEELAVAAETAPPPTDAPAAAAPDTEGDGTDESGGTDAPDPVEAAQPDEVIREPEDVAPDTADDEGGEARRVSPGGETKPLGGGEERPSPKAALVYNPIKADGDALRATVTRLSAQAGWSEPLFYETTVDDLGDDVTRQALEAGADAVLVAGGDGTVRAVSEAMSGSGVPLSIVPSGTGNLLARNLKLPLTEPEAMVRAVFDGDSVPMDVGWSKLKRADGKTEERAFVVMGGMGLDAAMIANTNAQLKKTVGWVAYVDGAARSLPNAKPFRVMYQLAGARLHSSRVQSILFANCGSLPAGLELIPEASVTDGALDIVIFQPKGLFGWIFVWRRVAWDNSFLRKFRAGRRVLALRTKDNSVRYSRGTAIEIAAQSAQPVQLDGDEFGEAVSVKTRVDAGALLVVVPKDHATDGL
ncbi:diacylglycerol/lipid kinase family protein [Microbacterium sp. CFBP9034]|uniref:diacylglycerol/lipid kinase family protein n=1 Tax=Microbacterium sp. CFBP9034 TaxID=3096540 RepID=UPI002A69A768|nr:diacylglycerol kinase family protein [Microbacterium sp. CFBP9034]MDY0908472.1 diacylglycerol kinase family protein [Microbacterium sp. CFBP9034]